jgi:hypothetical protein
MPWPASGRCFAPSGVEHGKKGYYAAHNSGNLFVKKVQFLSISRPLVRRVSRAKLFAAQSVEGEAKTRRQRRKRMRFMAIVKANKDSEAGVMPSKELLAAMGKFNEEMVKAGVLLAAEGLQASSKGARVRFSGTKRTVIDGPFAETKELIAGFWLLQVKSKEEAIEWIKRSPAPFEGEPEIEIRQVFEASDFPAEIFPPEDAAREQSMRDELQRKTAKP